MGAVRNSVNVEAPKRSPLPAYDERRITAELQLAMTMPSSLTCPLALDSPPGTMALMAAETLGVDYSQTRSIVAGTPRSAIRM